MLSEEQKKILKSKGFSDDKIREFEKSSDKLKNLHKKSMEEAELLSSEDIRKMAEYHEKAGREHAIKQWKEFKYNGVWPFTSIDSPSFIKEAQVSPYTSLYNYFRGEIGDEIDDL